MNYRAALERWAQHRRDRDWSEDKPPADQWIEYHATHAQLVYSGRCRIDQLSRNDMLTLDTHAHLLLDPGRAQIRYLFWRLATVETEWGPRRTDLITGETSMPAENQRETLST